MHQPVQNPLCTGTDLTRTVNVGVITALLHFQNPYFSLKTVVPGRQRTAYHIRLNIAEKLS